MQNLWAGIFSGGDGWIYLYKLYECNDAEGWDRSWIGYRVEKVKRMLTIKEGDTIKGPFWKEEVVVEKVERKFADITSSCTLMSIVGKKRKDM
ncbi:MAG: hypothetical protein DRN25_03440 [Thermoplasmata archaeon]|nr:MAG: hypothetical protein DRN25_03440 [Thermoplasmata archaeon]